MKKYLSKSHMGDLFALLLLAVFATGILSVLMTGAGVYRRLVDRDNYAYTTRTADRYVTVKVRQAPSMADITVETLGDVTALAIREEHDGSLFVTHIYCHDGYLCELFSAQDSGLAPEHGERILPIKAFDAHIENNILTVTLTDGDGSPREVILTLKKGEEVPA